jgi:hypothetical protein
METLVDRRVELRDGVTASHTTHWMHPERVVITRVSTVVVATIVVIVVVAAVVATVVVASAVGAVGSLLLGHLFPIIQVIVIPTGGCPRAQATISE